MRCLNMPLSAAIRIAFIMVASLTASPAHASDFSGFGVFLAIYALGFAVAGLVTGLFISAFLPQRWMKILVRTFGTLALPSFAVGLFFSLALMPVAIAVVIGTALMTVVLVGMRRDARSEDHDAR